MTKIVATSARRLVFAAVILCCFMARTVWAQDDAADFAPPDLQGEWIGTAEFLLPGGLVTQEHRFDIVTQTGVFFEGVHHWAIVDSDLTSHDGITYTQIAAEPFLGVVAHDQSIWVSEENDLTLFRMTLLADDRMGFVAFEGGPHALVAHGTLTRQ